MFGLNFVDIFIGCILVVRIFTGSSKTGIIGELINFIGLLVATFITFHYYSQLGKFFQGILFINRLPVNLVAYLVITILTIVIFYIIKEGWVAILHLDLLKSIDKWGGIIFATFSAFLLCGLVFFSFLILDNSKIYRMAQDSLSKKVFADISASIYSLGYTKLVLKIIPEEKVNSDVVEVLNKFHDVHPE